MTYVIAVDPGIDAVGVASFELKGFHHGESFAQAVGRLGHYQVLRTGPKEPLSARLSELHHGLRDVIRDLEPERVYIEQPTIAGAYWKRRVRQYSKTAVNAADMAKLYMAIGALVAAAAGELAEVVMVPASSTAKKVRLAIVRAQLKTNRHPLALRERVSEDLLDAIFLGAAALTNRRYQPTVAP